MSDEIQPGINDRVILRVAGDPDAVYAARVEDVEGRVVAISAPTAAGVPVRIEPGTSIELEWLLPHGPAWVSGHVEGPAALRIPALALRLTGHGRRLQRRRDVRVAVVLEAEIEPDREDEGDGAVEDGVAVDGIVGDHGPERARGYVVDLSGGGARVRCDLELGVDSKMTLGIDLSDREHLRLRARVVRIHEDGTYGVSFDSIGKADRERVIHYVFDCQRRQLLVRRA